MSDSLSIKQVQKDLKETLVGACLDRISYAITSWELRFVKKSQPDYHLYASDIIVPDVDTWFSALVDLPIDLTKTNEAADTVVAMVVFTAINKWPVSSILINQDADLWIEFANGGTIKIKGKVDLVVYAWLLETEQKDKFIFCDYGEFYGAGF